MRRRPDIDQHEQRDIEMRRMLLAFKAWLPPHDLEWTSIEACPTPPPVCIEGGPMFAGGVKGPDTHRIRGRATCRRCKHDWRIPDIGNAIAFDASSIDSTVETMKAWVQREADRSECWGDVPQVSNDHFATLD